MYKPALGLAAAKLIPTSGQKNRVPHRAHRSANAKRGQGLGITLLRLTLEQAYTLGITEVHVHCYKRNEPSAKMILACGGRLDSEVVAGEEVVQRYVVGR